ncbi:MAG: hypothetical protein ACRC2O_05295, partial [Chitinophagaceae bacterium]
VGSCWQAGSGIAHFYNMYSDYLAGVIDRHNYSGGGTGHTFQPGKIENEPMVGFPGSGLLSTGFQQVADRPFQISEWMALIPNQWTAESSPIIATYGMGLQGWDASYAFAMDFSDFTSTIQSRHGVYNVTSPTQLALYPPLAAMLYRNDIKEGATVFKRNINLIDLQNGKLTVDEKIAQQFDVKKFTSLIPEQVLGIGKVSLTFNSPSAFNNSIWKKYLDTARRIVQSNTGQLSWDYSGKGFFTINSKGTKGIVGFADGKTFHLGELTIQPHNPFVVILVSSMDRNKDISTSNKILVTTMARAKNTEMELNADSTRLLNVGTAPILLEPVQVTLIIKRKNNPKIFALDHSGNRTLVQVPVYNGKIFLDGKKYKTLYYEIVYN